MLPGAEGNGPIWPLLGVKTSFKDKVTVPLRADVKLLSNLGRTKVDQETEFKLVDNVACDIWFMYFWDQRGKVLSH